MRDPFQPRPATVVAIAQLALPVLLDRLGGSATVTEGELQALSERYGGGVSVSATKSSETEWRLTLIPSGPLPPEPPPS